MIEDAKKFYKKTKFKVGAILDWIDDFKPPISWVKIFFKTYPRFSQIPLEPSSSQEEIYELLDLRHSTRDFDSSEVPFEKISRVISSSAGIHNKPDAWEHTRRSYPSAGARYPIETYLISSNISHIPRGLYHYNLKNNSLEVLLNKDLREDSNKIFGDANKDNPNYLILTGVLSRTEVKYGLNAYRFALIESGHIGQNISLTLEKEGLGGCALGGFDNDKISSLLDINQEDEIPLYAFSFGCPKK